MKKNTTCVIVSNKQCNPSPITLFPPAAPPLRPLAQQPLERVLRATYIDKVPPAHTCMCVLLYSRKVI